MRRVYDLPLIVILMGVSALAMYIPAVHALSLRDLGVARAFFYSATVLLILTTMVAIATANHVPRNATHSHLRALMAAYLLLPLMLAVPFVQAVPDTSFLNATFEMVSSFTTTGATLYDTPGRLPPSVHLWRAVVGWFGGYFVLLTAAAILAPLNLGGFEVLSPRSAGRSNLSFGQITRLADPSARILHHAKLLFPIYAGLTIALWVGLLLAGDPSLVALTHAMAVISTSGISPVNGLSGASSGIAGEALLFLGMMFAVTRRSMPGAPRIDAQSSLQRDPEVRLALFFCTTVPLALFLRHWIGAIEVAPPESLMSGTQALWGSVFTVLSFLTTTGFESEGWLDARQWSGLETPGLILLGLAMMGGGVATTAGGVKLFRVYALYRLGRREMDKLSEPSSVAGGGPVARQLRQEGAYIAFIFFMLFALTLGAMNAALALAGIGFEKGVVLSVASLTTTGPLANVASDAVSGFGGLNAAAKVILALGMVLGRLETLALLAVLAPAAWRR
ncbi:MAG: potassium transporter TrkG [Gemmobacter sp.]|nr:potassium transporter TrkG [Gemmobacter sp.]